MLSTKSDHVHLSVAREPGEAYQASPGTKRERRYRIQPPPKIVLEVDSDDPKCNWLENPRTFLMARLPSRPNILFGKTVESIQRIGDQAVFIFRDLSCQEAGEHQLRFTLFSRDSDSEPAYMVKHIESQPFVVVANRSARRRSDRSKLSPRLRHRLSSREALCDRVRLEPKKNKSVPKLPLESKHHIIDGHDSPGESMPIAQGGMVLSPTTSSPTLASSHDSMYGYMSSPPGYPTLFSSQLSGLCGMDVPRSQMAFTPSFHSSNFSGTINPRDSALPVMPWLGDGVHDTDPVYEGFGDNSESLSVWGHSSPYSSAELQSHSMPLLQPHWRMGIPHL